MPLYDFQCPAGCPIFEATAPMDIGETQCRCGAMAKRLFSPTTSLIFPAHMMEVNAMGRARHQAWLNSAKTKQERDDGKWVPESEA